MRSAFTLIELLISITILSILMLALYKAYDALNISNEIYKEKSQAIKSIELKKRTIYLDFALSVKKDDKDRVTYLEKDTEEDIVTFAGSNSIHKRYNPYITYLVKNKILYRVESLQEIKEYPFAADIRADIDVMGEVKKFKVFKSKNNDSYLIDARFKDENNILLKVKALNEI
ncbi:PulJ/GspJ family protein [Sulfurimonas lithotrophica]|uniref:PulJ/GspJ family protein n=1 Tax=Sulfurimonas lithotrophica TaxID=2590022 RepID=UPI00165FE03F|nr:prepilin-type N-terminal cleavage/methylation domain-containing protein [Sulfurimonas lithotrophica]